MLTVRRGPLAGFATLWFALVSVGEPSTELLAQTPVALERIEVASLSDAQAYPLVFPSEVWEAAGEYLVVDFSDRNIKVYDRSGSRSQTVGRAGLSTGEFGMLLSAFPSSGGIRAYDFSGADIVSMDSTGAELSRFPLVNAREEPQPISVRSLEDGRMLAVFQARLPGDALLQVFAENGERVLQFMELSERYTSDPLMLGEKVLADGHDRCVFAATARSDSVRVFDYDGALRASGVIDPRRRWAPSDAGAWGPITSASPAVVNVIALPGCRALVQTRDWMIAETRRQLAPTEGGEIALLGTEGGRVVRLGGAQFQDGGLLGRDARGRGLFIARPTERQGDFTLYYLKEGS